MNVKGSNHRSSFQVWDVYFLFGGGGLCWLGVLGVFFFHSAMITLGGRRQHDRACW